MLELYMKFKCILYVYVSQPQIKEVYMSAFKKVSRSIFGRLKTKSTVTGVSMLLAALGIHLDPESMSKIVETLFEVVGLFFVVTKD